MCSSDLQEQEVARRRLTFWRNGFSVEDGDLLVYDDPKNKEILEALKSGSVFLGPFFPFIDAVPNLASYESVVHPSLSSKSRWTNKLNSSLPIVKPKITFANRHLPRVLSPDQDTDWAPILQLFPLPLRLQLQHLRQPPLLRVSCSRSTRMNRSRI